MTNSGLHFSTPHAVLLSLCPLLWRECLHAISLLPASPFFVPWHLPHEALLPPQRRMPGTRLPLSQDSFLLPPPLVAEFHGQGHFQFISVALSVPSLGTGRAQIEGVDMGRYFFFLFPSLAFPLVREPKGSFTSFLLTAPHPAQFSFQTHYLSFICSLNKYLLRTCHVWDTLT